MEPPIRKLRPMQPKPKAMRGARIAWLATVLVALTLGVIAAVAMQPAVSGQFHDDALYLSTAQSLANGQGYRHASLPTNPIQTKYPPLYSAAMAVVWKIAPSFPDNVRWFKLTSVLFLTLAVLLAGALGRRRFGGMLAPPALAFLVGASPLVFPFADYALTELPFLVLCLAAFWIAPLPRGREDSTGEGGVGRAAALGIVCGLALLVRQAALPLILAGFVLIEKVAPAGTWISRATGALLTGWGVWMVLDSAL